MAGERRHCLCGGSGFVNVSTTGSIRPAPCPGIDVSVVLRAADTLMEAALRVERESGPDLPPTLSALEQLRVASAAYDAARKEMQ